MISTEQTVAGNFQPTRWSLVARAADPAEPVSQRALEELCTLYWPPLYRFARRRGLNPADAEDATQGFFMSILERGTLENARAEKGRLRTFLLTAFQRWLIDFDERRHALKRGGGKQIVSLDQAWAEEEFAREPADPRGPEEEFNRRWALTLLDAAIAQVEKGWAEQGKAEQFEAMRPFLGFSAAGEDSYEAIAEALDVSEGALRVAVHRLRKQFRDALFAVIAETLEVPSEENLRAEVRALLGALGG